MTTQAAEERYLSEHLYQYQGRSAEVFNPHSKPLEDLPIIYGFNNGGSTSLLQAVLLAEDGTGLGGHACSHEDYMPHDLGILEGTRPDRHEGFREHYPDGYKMEFVGYDDVKNHEGLKIAMEKHKELNNG